MGFVISQFSITVKCESVQLRYGIAELLIQMVEIILAYVTSNLCPGLTIDVRQQ
ncbi:hypothetical protein D3C71_1775350 [compost metagenome]